MAQAIAPVFVESYSANSALGNTIAAHWQAIVQKQTGILYQPIAEAASEKIYCSKVQQRYKPNGILTLFELLAADASLQALEDVGIAKDKIAFILSTTKGNIEHLGSLPDEHINLAHTAKKIAHHIGIGNALVVSQACISGVVAIQYAQFLLQSQQYDAVLVCGADRLSQFVYKGFQSFQAVAPEPCRPFDENRKGINLGEAAAALLLTKVRTAQSKAQILAASTSNDANHISGPSRTGAELAMAITQAMNNAHVKAHDISMISAHGTATPYNDEMEAKALHLCGLDKVPTHSFKSFIGHTLGAAGVIETTMCIEALKQQKLIPSLQYQNHGVSTPINICTEPMQAPLNTILKTASGFGGTNAALVLAAL